MPPASRSITRAWLSSLETRVHLCIQAIDKGEGIATVRYTLVGLAQSLNQAAVGDVRLELEKLVSERIRAQYSTYNSEQRERMAKWMVSSVEHSLTDTKITKLVDYAVENWRRYAGGDPRGAWEYMSEQKLPPPDPVTVAPRPGDPFS